MGTHRVSAGIARRARSGLIASVVLAAVFLSAALTPAVAMDPSGPWFHFMVPSAHTGGGGWTPNTQVTIEVSTNGVPGAEYTDVVMSDGSGGINSNPTTWTVDWGNVVTVSDGVHTKTHTITYVQIADFDLLNDTVHGFAAYDTTVQVEAHNNDVNEHSNRTVNSGGAPGGWTANFSEIEGLNPIIDIRYNTNLTAIALDGDGDGTQVDRRVPFPIIQIDARLDEVNGWDWPPSSSATVTIDDPAVGTGVDLTFAVSTDEGGSLHRYMWEIDQEHPFDITPGTVVTITDGTFTKSHTVTGVMASGADAASDVVTGTAAPGSAVQVEIFGLPGYQPRRETTASPGGTWSVSFATTDTTNPDPDDPSRDPFNIILGTTGAAEQSDGDSDRTRSTWHVLNPNFNVDRSGDGVAGGDWPTNSVVTISVDNYPPGGGSDFMMTAQTDDNGWFQRSTWEVADPGFDITTFARVTVSCGPYVKTTDVTNVEVSGADVDAETVSGTAAASTEVVVCIWGVPGYQPRRTVTADIAGNWTASFATTDTSNTNLDDQGRNPFDLQPGTNGCVQQTDIDGDITQVGWRVLNPLISVSPDGDSVWGNDFTAGSQVTVTIDDPSNGASIDCTMHADHDSMGNFECNTGEADDGFDITAGMLVTVRDGVNTKDHVVRNLHTGGVDEDSNIVTGTADPGSQVQVDVQTGEDQQPMRFVTADGNGLWVADFGTAVPGNEDTWGKTCDLQAGMEGNASQAEPDGDSTQARWFVPDPLIWVNPEYDWIQAWNWPARAHVLFTVDDLDTGVGADFETSGTCDSDGWLELWAGNDVKPGMVVNATDGTHTRVLTVSNAAVTDVDVEGDIVSGVAEPESWVVVQVYDDNGTQRTVRASVGGTWSADFSESVGDEPQQGRVDINPGTEGQANQNDEDGDQTQANWRVPNPSFWVDPQQERIGGSEFTPSADIFISIENSTTPKSPDVTLTVAAGQNGDFYVDQDLGDLNGDCVVIVTDGTHPKTLDVTNLAITSVDVDNDIVYGTADPFTEVGSWCGEFWGGDSPIADGSGHWMMDYGAFTNPVVDIGLGSSGGAQVGDEDGDQTMVEWYVQNPRIMVGPAKDWLEGHEWPADVEVLITIDDPAIPGNPDFVTTATPDANGDFGTMPYIGFDIKSGQTVIYTNGTTTRTHVVTALTITGVDAETETVWGTAAPNSGGQLEVWNEWGTWRHIGVDGDGHWIVDFTDDVGMEDWMRGCDLVKGTEGRGYQGDDQGNQTVAEWHIPNPTFRVECVDGGVWGDDFLPSATVTVTVDASGTPPGAETAYTLTTEFDGTFATNGPEPLHTGDTVTVTDGTTIKTHVVLPLAMTSLNRHTGIIRGTATPNATLLAWWDGYGGGEFYADENGEWLQDDSRGSLDLGQTGWVEYPDSDGDATHVSWSVDNHAPSASDDATTIAEDGRAVLNVLANDGDADYDSMTASLTSGPAHGALSFSASGVATYTPNANWHGIDTFTYSVSDGSLSDTASVSITVTAVNDAPVAADDAADAEQDTTLTIPARGVLSNDVDADGDFLTASLTSGPAHGTLALSADGSYAYRPANGYFGIDGFTYKASDGTELSAGATVVISVGRSQPTVLRRLSASKTIVTGGSYTLRARLTTTTGPVVGANVTLEKSTNGVTFTSAGVSASTNASGEVSFVVRPTIKTWYRARFARAFPLLASSSSAAVVSVRASVGTPIAPTRMSHSRSYTVRGYLVPKHPSRSIVRIYKWRRVSGRWKSYGYVNARTSYYSSTKSKYSIKMRLKYRGKWRLRAYHRDAGHARAWSKRYDYVTVR